MTKVDIFSGFLGAGKTTLIKKLIEEAYAGEQLVLIENEFGEIGIDGGFLKDSGIQINEMNSGCICCSLVGDFGTALSDVIEKFSPDRILIEPSGVGKLSDVIKAVEDLHNPEIVLNGFTTVVDAKKCKMYMKNFGEFFDNQVEHASSIILSHTDGLSREKLDQCVELLRSHNDRATIVTTEWNCLTGAQILETMENAGGIKAELAHLEEEVHHHHPEHHEHKHPHEHHEHKHPHEHPEHNHCGCEEHHHHHADEVFDSIGFETSHRFKLEDVERALEKLQNFTEYGQVLRAKGIVEAEEGKWIHFDYVPGESDVRYGSAAVTGMLCIIGVDIEEGNVKELFKL